MKQNERERNKNKKIKTFFSLISRLLRFHLFMSDSTRGFFFILFFFKKGKGPTVSRESRKSEVKRNKIGKKKKKKKEKQKKKKRCLEPVMIIPSSGEVKSSLIFLFVSFSFSIKDIYTGYYFFFAGMLLKRTLALTCWSRNILNLTHQYTELERIP